MCDYDKLGRRTEIVGAPPQLCWGDGPGGAALPWERGYLTLTLATVRYPRTEYRLFPE